MLNLLLVSLTLSLLELSFTANYIQGNARVLHRSSKYKLYTNVKEHIWLFGLKLPSRGLGMH